MSEYSQAHSTCSRTTDFSFVFQNSAFSDAVLVVLTLRPKGASIPWRLASSVAQLFVSAVEVSATTLSSTVPVGDTVYAAGKALGSLGQTVVSRLSPKDCQEVAIAQVYQVNSALLAASSPFLRHIIQHPPSLAHLVPGLSSVAARHRQRKLVTVLIQPHHVAAAEVVVKFIFSNDIALAGAQQALDCLLVAEQLQVPDCAEVCCHYLEDCAMDFPVALTLVHLQHKHQQEQQHQRQQQWQQQQPQGACGGGGGGSVHRNSSSAASVASTRRGAASRPPLQTGRSSMGSGLLRGLGGGGTGSGGNSGLDSVAPLLPVPSESVYLQGLLLRAQDFLVHEFEDLELVLASAEGRQRLLLLPYDALRAILGHPRLRVASENTALLAAAGWLQANAAQVSSLLLLSPAAAAASAAAGGGIGSSSNGGAAAGWGGGGGGGVMSNGDLSGAQGVCGSALYNSGSSNGLAKGTPAEISSSPAAPGQQQSSSGGAAAAAALGGAAAAAGGSSSNSIDQLVQQTNGAASQLPPQHQQPPTASGVASLLLDLCQVLRLCQCSFTYIVHVLPQLPLFRDQPKLVAALQFEVLRYRAAGKLRQRRLAAEAAAAAAAAAAATAAAAAPSLTGQHLAGLEQQQQQQGMYSSSRVKTPAAGGGGGVGSGSDSSTELTKGAVAAAAAAGAPAWPGGAAAAGIGSSAVGWRSGCSTTDAALLQCQLRPESARTTLDFTYCFDPQLLAGPDASKAAGRGGGAAGSNGVAAAAGATTTNASGVDLMQRLLGLTPQAQPEATLMSEDHYFAGYVWNMVVAADGFVGISWRVVLPGGGDVPLPGPHTQQQLGGGAAGAGAGAGDDAGWGPGSIRLFGPDCAGLRSPEVAVTFSITGMGLSRSQHSTSSSGNLAAVTGAAAGSSAGGASTASGSDAATAKPGSKADQSPMAAAASSGAAGSTKGGGGGGGIGTPQQPQQHSNSNSNNTATSQQSSPMKQGGSKPVVGRAYSEVQFVPGACAWGFPDFAAAGGWEALRGADGKVSLRCQLRHRE